VSPKNKDEKIAIADILIKADDELDLLQKELEEQKRKKQFLMQLLLTGIVRVKA
jgi:putative hsdS